MYLVYVLWCVLVLSAYTANLTAFLTVSKTTTSVSSLQDIMRYDYQMGYIPGNAAYQYLVTASNDDLATSLVNNLTPCNTTKDCLAMLTSGEIAGFTADQPVGAWGLGPRASRQTSR